MESNTEPVSENLNYGDSITNSARRHLSKYEFPPGIELRVPSVDSGWLGPEGSYGNPSSSGSLYGYDQPSSSPPYNPVF